MASHSSPEYQREWRERNPERVREYQRRYRASENFDREKRRARDRLNDAVRRGKILRPLACQVCGLAPGHDHLGRSLVQGHHPDHARWWDVIWCDPTCHAQLEPA